MIFESIISVGVALVHMIYSRKSFDPSGHTELSDLFKFSYLGETLLEIFSSYLLSLH